MPLPQRKDSTPALEVETVIARFDGDAYAALTAALDDIAFLQQELRFAGLAMSYGFARGWTPALSGRPEKSSANRAGG